MNDYATLLIGIVCAGVGGELFIRGAVGLTQWLRVAPGIIGAVVAAFATSSPELTVSSVAALAGEPQIGLGDALGSNVVNIALIFGLALLYGAVPTRRDDFGRDFYLALAVPVLTLVFVLDGQLARVEALLLLAAFAAWLAVTLRRALRERDAPAELDARELSAGRSLLLGALGLAALIAAGRLFVGGATGIAAAFAVDTYVVGVVLVAIGTSLPELVTVLLSRLRGHDDVGVGTLIGSNLFNGLAIVGIAGVIHPIAVPLAEVALTLACGMAALLMLRPDRRGLIGRGRGALLLLLYAGFVWLTLAA